MREYLWKKDLDSDIMDPAIDAIVLVKCTLGYSVESKMGGILIENRDARALADAIYADLGLGWTLTEDALPPENVEVLAALDGIVFVEHINPDKVAEQDEEAYLPDEFRRTFDRWMFIPSFRAGSEEA